MGKKPFPQGSQYLSRSWPDFLTAVIGLLQLRHPSCLETALAFVGAFPTLALEATTLFLAGKFPPPVLAGELLFVLFIQFGHIFLLFFSK